MELELQVEGRHSGLVFANGLPLRNKNISASSSPCADSTVVRLDDADNPPFWMQIRFTKAQLLAMIEEIDGYKDD